MSIERGITKMSSTQQYLKHFVGTPPDMNDNFQNHDLNVASNMFKSMGENENVKYYLDKKNDN